MQIWTNVATVSSAWAMYSGNDHNSLQFKQAFCREQVDIHFVGVWDTVASVGVLPRKPFPLTDKCQHITHFRHALALDELRVKFLPEHINDTPRGNHTLKEVWFAGTHSDIGGGNKSNPTLDRGGEPLKWMMEEAQECGLSVRLHDVKIGVPHAEVTNSMRWKWWILEILPISWKKYAPNYHFTVMRQSIHWTVGASLDKSDVNKPTNLGKQYRPEAKPLGFDGEIIEWENMSMDDRRIGEPRWEDEYEFRRLVNILKAEPKSARSSWFSHLYDYACGQNSHGKPEVIWAYGGPQFLQRIFRLYGNDPKTTQLARLIIGFDHTLPWSGLEGARALEERNQNEKKEQDTAKRLQEMIIPRVGLLLAQWVTDPRKSGDESESDSGSELDSESLVDSKAPKQSHWGWILSLFKSGASHVGETDPVGTQWNLDRVPKDERSIALAHAVVDLVLDLTKTKYVSVLERASSRLATVMAGLIADLTNIDEDNIIESAEDWEADKAAFAEAVLNVVDALFKYDASRKPFYEGKTGRKLQPLIRARRTYLKMGLQSIRTVALLSLDDYCGADIADSEVIQELIAIVGDYQELQDRQAEPIFNEALTVMATLSRHSWCALALTEEKNLNVLIKLLERQACVNDVLRILGNSSKEHPDQFFPEHVRALAPFMRQNNDAIFTLANILREPGRSYYTDFLNEYSQEGVVSTSIELLQHTECSTVLLASRLLRNLVFQAEVLKSSPDEPQEINLPFVELARALSDALKSPQSNDLVEDLLATDMRVTLQEPIPDDHFAVLESLASKNSTRAILAASAGAAHDKNRWERVDQYVPTLVQMLGPEDRSFLKASMEVLTVLVKQGYILPDPYLKDAASRVAIVVRSVYASTGITSTGQRIITIAAFNLTEALCSSSLTRSCVIDSGILKAAILSRGNPGGYNWLRIEDHEKAMMLRLGQYDDLAVHIQSLRREAKKSEIEREKWRKHNYEDHAELPDETTPLIARR